MTAMIPLSIPVSRPFDRQIPLGDAELAAAPFLSRYQGPTLDAFRYDLRAFFQWATGQGLEVLKATRPEIELYVRAMEERGLASTTIDRRLSTVCGFYRFAQHRRPHPGQPGAVCPPTQSPPHRGPGT